MEFRMYIAAVCIGVLLSSSHCAADCIGSGTFCLQGKQCFCVNSVATCLSFDCTDEDSLGGCYDQNFGCDFLAPCPDNHTRIDPDGGEDYCYYNPGDDFCYSDDCNSCLCNDEDPYNLIACTRAYCPPPGPEAAEYGTCVQDGVGRCIFRWSL